MMRFFWLLDTEFKPVRKLFNPAYFATLLLLAGAYALSGWLGLLLSSAYEGVAPVWPASGIVLAAAFLLGPRMIPAAAIGQAAWGILGGYSLVTTLTVAAGSTLEPAFAYYMLRKFGFHRTFDQGRDVVLFAVFAVVLAPVISGLFGATGLILGGEAAPSDFASVFWTWTQGDSIGIVVVTPFLLALSSRTLEKLRNPLVAAEAAFILLAIAALTYIGFTGPRVLATVFPLLLWAIYRHGLALCMAGLLIILGISSWQTGLGHGPLAAGDIATSVLYLQIFVGTASLTVLALSAFLSERRRLEEERAELIKKQAIQEKVAETQKQFALLAELSETLNSSFEQGVAIQQVARLLSRDFTDCCVVSLIDEEDRPLKQGVASRDAKSEAVLSWLINVVKKNPASAAGFQKRMASGRGFLAQDGVPQTLAVFYKEEEDRRLHESLQIESMIAVPMFARGRRLGSIVFLNRLGSPRYTQEDLTFAEDVARRCAIVVDNIRLYDEAREAVRLREEFLSVAAHELKTPVTSLRAFAQLLLRQSDKTGVMDQLRVRRGLQVIDQQSGKLARLVSQLLDIARIQSGKLSIEKKDVCLTNIVREIVEAAQVQSSLHSFRVTAPTLQATVDPVRIEQVLANLLDNAMKYSPDGGQIDVEVDRLGDGTVTLAVRDRGIGIPVENRTSIFERFNQAHLRSHVSGMGLGLYLSRQIVELHGGQIEVESPEDGGTRVIVRLPVREK